MSKFKFRFVQISDLHLVADEEAFLFDTNPFLSFKAVIKRIKTLSPKPDFLLLTGDMAHKEQEKPYELVEKVIEPTGFDYYWLEGNHDNIAAMKNKESTYSVKSLRSFEHKDFYFILLNSVAEANSHGLFSSDTLDFLEERLEASKDKPCIIAFHHHILPTGCAWLDKSIIKNSDSFFEIVSQYKHIRAILHGHIHSDLSTERYSIPIFSTPSTAFQFDLKTETFGIEHTTAGFRVFDIDERNHLETFVERLD